MRNTFRVHERAITLRCLVDQILPDRTTMTFTWKCYQSNFLIDNLNIASVGGEWSTCRFSHPYVPSSLNRLFWFTDRLHGICIVTRIKSRYRSLPAALLIEQYQKLLGSVQPDIGANKKKTKVETGCPRSPVIFISFRMMLHLLRTLVHVAQTALSYILMLMVMNNFAGFLLSAVTGMISDLRSFPNSSSSIHLALGIGYYLLNGVHPYTRSANDVQILRSSSDLIQSRENLDERREPSRTSTTTDIDQATLTINA